MAKFKLKKFVKKISLKNAVKLASKVSAFVPGAGGIIAGMAQEHMDKRAAKKAEQQAIRDAQAQIPQFDQMSNTEKVDVVNQMAMKGVGIKDVLSGALGGALTGAGTALAGDTNIQNAGATVVDGTITAYLKKNWLKVLGILGVATTFVILLTRSLKPKRGRR